MKLQCPHCAESVPASSTACPYCMESFSGSSQPQSLHSPKSGSHRIFENPSNGYRVKVPIGPSAVTCLLGPVNFLFRGMCERGIAWLLGVILLAPILGAVILIMCMLIAYIIAALASGGRFDVGLEGLFLLAGMLGSVGAPAIIWGFVGYRTNRELAEHFLMQGWKEVTGKDEQ